MQEAVVLHRQGALADAVMRYTEVIRREPKNVDAVFFLALIMTQQREFQEAVRLLRKVIKLAPPHAGAHNLLGATLRATGHHDEALRSFKRALTHKPDFFEAYVNAAQSLIDRCETAAAKRSV